VEIPAHNRQHSIEQSQYPMTKPLVVSQSGSKVLRTTMILSHFQV
jgi:hypothetical protein